MFWLRNKKYNFPVRTLIWRPEQSTEYFLDGWNQSGIKDSTNQESIEV